MLTALRGVGDFCIGHYHLMLAHDCAARPSLYKGVVPERSFVIMDNSLIELGQPVTDGAIMVKALEAVPSNCVVLPDVAHNCDKTVELSKQAAAEWKGLPGYPFLMGVPQGNTLEEYVQCALQLKEIEGLLYWGIPRTVVNKLGSRRELVQKMREIGTKYHRGLNDIHLLGFSDNIPDDMLCSKLQGVMGIDSAVPIRAGQRRLLIENLADWGCGKRGTFWDDPVDRVEPETLANIYLVRNWII
jgi:hypothetical protein